jgi:hypothetical protein
VKAATLVAPVVLLVLGGGGVAAIAQPADTRSPGNTLTAESPAPDSSPVTPPPTFPPGARYGAEDADRIRNDLHGNGYSELSNLRREGTHWTVDAKRDGKAVKLRIDGDSGQVSPVGG